MQEASGWPSSARTEEEKDVYIETFRAKLGITLERDKIAPNKALR